MKITAAQREFRRYTGVSAEVERRGLGSSRSELAWAHRIHQQQKENDKAADKKIISKD